MIIKDSSKTFNNLIKFCIFKLHNLYFVELLGRQQSFVCQYWVVLQGWYLEVEYCTSMLERYVLYNTSVLASPYLLAKLAVAEKG